MLSEEFKRILDGDIRDHVIHGGVVLAGMPDRELIRVETGYADYADQYPMTANTVIDVASVTKVAATVTSLLVAHSRGLIDFDAPFTEYLPEFQAELKYPVRVRDLVNHRSGFHDVPGKPRLYFDESGQKMLDNVMHLPPVSPPTEKTNYACWNYILLCKVLEHAVKMSLPEFARKNIYLPLGMKDTSVGAPLPSIPLQRLAQTIDTPSPGVISDFVAVRIYRDGGSTGNAGCFSTAEDLAKLLKCYLAHGHGLFSETEFRLIAPDTAETYDGYRRFGWIIADNYLRRDLIGKVLFHSGWSGQTIFFNPEKDLYGMILTNRCGDYVRAKTDRFDVLHKICDAF